MSTVNIGATPGDFLVLSSCLPPNLGASDRKCSKAPRRVYKHADAVCPLIYSHWQILPLNHDTLHSVEAVPDPKSHDCQRPPLSYSRSPTQSFVHDPHFEPRQLSPSSPRPDANRDEEFLHDGFQDRYPPLFLTNDAPSLAPPFLAPGVGPPPLQESSGAAFIPNGRKFPDPSTGNSPDANVVPCMQSHEDRLDRRAWMPAISLAKTNRYRYNDVEVVIPYGLQSNFQLSHRPRKPRRSYPVPEPYFGTTPMPSLSRPFPVFATTDYSSFPPSQATPPPQSLAPNAEDLPEKKYRCSICGSGFTLPQVLGRHMKDTHEPKKSCSHCLSQGLSFTYSRGRPYVYQKHLARKHPKIAATEVRQNPSGDTKESSNLGARQAHANYVPYLTRAVPLQDMSHYPWAKW